MQGEFSMDFCCFSSKKRYCASEKLFSIDEVRMVSNLVGI